MRMLQEEQSRVAMDAPCKNDVLHRQSMPQPTLARYAITPLKDVLCYTERANAASKLLED